MLQLLFDEGAVVKQLALVAPRPFAGHESLDVVKLTGFERLELRGGVFVKLVSDAVEIEHATTRPEVFRPIVGVAHVLDVFAKVGFAQLVGAGGDRHVGDDLVQGLACAPLLAEHRHAADDERQFGVGAFELELDFPLGQDGGALDLAEIGAKLRRGFFAGEAVKRIFHIGGQHRVVVVKPGIGVQPEGDGQLVGCHGHVLGQQAVSGGRFFGVAHQQGFKHQETQARGCRALHGERVVFVKTGSAGWGHQSDVAALGRDRVDMAEMFEAGRVEDVAKLGIGVRRPHGGRATQPNAK